LLRLGLLSNSNSPFRYDKKFTRATNSIEKSLHVGCLVKTQVPDDLYMIYLGHNKNKKIWHRTYRFLVAGRQILLLRNQLYLLDVI